MFKEKKMSSTKITIIEKNNLDVALEKNITELKLPQISNLIEYQSGGEI